MRQLALAVATNRYRRAERQRLVTESDAARAKTVPPSKAPPWMTPATCSSPATDNKPARRPRAPSAGHSRPGRSKHRTLPLGGGVPAVTVGSPQRVPRWRGQISPVTGLTPARRRTGARSSGPGRRSPRRRRLPGIQLGARVGRGAPATGGTGAGCWARTGDYWASPATKFWALPLDLPLTCVRTYVLIVRTDGARASICQTSTAPPRSGSARPPAAG